MSKYYNIRWRESDNDELRKAVKNFNAKITRLERNNPELKNALPERVSVRQMKELIDTRQDLNRELNSLRRFTKRGSEELVTIPDSDYNLKTTKWQKEEMSRRVGIINRKRKKRLDELSDIEMTSRGEKLGYTKGEFGMGKADEVALSPMNAFTPKMTRHDLNKKFSNIMKESQSTYWNAREQTLKATYVRTLTENFKESDIQDVIDAIDDMDFKEFYSTFQSEGGNFEFVYSPDEEQYESYVTALKTTWIPNK
jgi:hypothetical protein